MYYCSILKLFLLFSFIAHVNARFYRNVPYANIYAVYKPAEIESEVAEVGPRDSDVAGREESGIPEVPEVRNHEDENYEVSKIRKQLFEKPEVRNRILEGSKFGRTESGVPEGKKKESGISNILPGPPPPAHLFILRPDYALMKINTVANAVKDLLQKRWIQELLEEK